MKALLCVSFLLVVSHVSPGQQCMLPRRTTGYISLDPQNGCSYVDTVVIDGLKAVGGDVFIGRDYRVAIGLCGQLYIAKNTFKYPVTKPAYVSPGPGCNQIENCASCMLFTADNKLLFIRTKDSYLWPKKYFLNELNLATNAVRTLDRGKSITLLPCPAEGRFVEYRKGTAVKRMAL